MWKMKTFKTWFDMDAWIKKHGHRYQWVKVFINQPTSRHHGYGLEYKKKRRM